MIFPDPGAASSIPLHVLVRDFPETLAVLRNAGVDVAAAGGSRLGDLEVEHGPGLVEALAAATTWRAGSPAGPCDRTMEAARAHAAAARELERAAGESLP